MIAAYLGGGCLPGPHRKRMGIFSMPIKKCTSAGFALTGHFTASPLR
jgi:hypothetical protein